MTDTGTRYELFLFGRFSKVIWPTHRQFTALLCTHRNMSRFKFGVAAVEGHLEFLPMARVSVNGGGLLKQVVAAQLQLTAEEAVEKISRLEVFTSCDFKGKATLSA